MKHIGKVGLVREKVLRTLVRPEPADSKSVFTGGVSEAWSNYKVAKSNDGKT